MPDLVTIPFAGIPFELRDAPGAPAVFLFGVRKSGSSIMNSMVAALARMNGVHYVDVAGSLFAAGIPVPAWQADPGLGALLRGGNAYGGFRNAPTGIAGHPLLLSSPKLLLVRDPRDALVSEYFSNAWSHSLPQGGEAREMMLRSRSEARATEIDEYVLRMAPALRATLRDYLPFLDMPGLRLHRYEEAVMDKRRFLLEACAQFGWRVSAVQLDQILGWADVMPVAEDPTRFVRKVRPGDHLEKLAPATISDLSSFFAAELTAFGY